VTTHVRRSGLGTPSRLYRPAKGHQANLCDPARDLSLIKGFPLAHARARHRGRELTRASSWAIAVGRRRGLRPRANGLCWPAVLLSHGISECPVLVRFAAV